MAYSVAAEATAAAPPKAVFEHIAKAEAWAVWGGFSASGRERSGFGEPDGVGAIRRVRMGPGYAREEAVAYEPYRHYAYRLISWLPVRDYRADVTLEPTPEGGTTIHWKAVFEAPVFPGTGQAMHVAFGRMVDRLARQVATHVDHCDPACPAYQHP